MDQILNEHNNSLRILDNYYGHNLIHAEIRYLLIKSAARYQRTEERRLGEAYRKKRALNEFCNKNGVSFQTLYRYRRSYRKGGIEALIPKFGNRRDRIKQNRELNRGHSIRAEIEIDLHSPLRCLKDIEKAIKDTPAINPDTKESAILYLDHCLKYALVKPWIYKGVSLKRELSYSDLEKLNSYKKGTHRNHRDKAIAIIMACSGRSMLEITTIVRRSPTTVKRWINRFEKDGTVFIETNLDKRKNNPELKERTNRIIKILHRSPKDYKINRTAWHIEAIAAAYGKDYGKTLSTSAIHRAIKDTNYSWRRAKKVLTSPDPKYRQKVRDLLDVLHNLRPDQAFFFIDEAGPWPVKKYGGKSLTAKGENKTFPQYQTIKGRVSLIGALDAIKNQVHWFFIKNKDSNAITALIKILYYRHNEYSNLFLTWDQASWHKSKIVKACIASLNTLPRGPTIHALPLPSQAQFLNVIESVFGGVKRAVIFNSNYHSENEMKTAIYNHLLNRNEYFKINPKRAGSKIWDNEIYDIEEIESGIFKRV